MENSNLNNCCYDKVKLLHLACKLRWFIEKHAEQDAKTANDEKFYATLQDMKKDLEKNIEKLKNLLGKDLA